MGVDVLVVDGFFLLFLARCSDTYCRLRVQLATCDAADPQFKGSVGWQRQIVW